MPYCEYNSCAKVNHVFRNQSCSEILLAQDLGKVFLLSLLRDY